MKRLLLVSVMVLSGLANLGFCSSRKILRLPGLQALVEESESILLVRVLEGSSDMSGGCLQVEEVESFKGESSNGLTIRLETPEIREFRTCRRVYPINHYLLLLEEGSIESSERKTCFGEGSGLLAGFPVWKGAETLLVAGVPSDLMRRDSEDSSLSGYTLFISLGRLVELMGLVVPEER